MNWWDAQVPWEVAALIVGGMFAVAGLIVAAINIHHAGWRAGFRRANEISDGLLHRVQDAYCYGCGAHICEPCHERVEMPLGAHTREAHVSREGASLEK